jgi:hypothetical protein
MSKFLTIIVMIFIFTNIAVAMDDLEKTPQKTRRVPVNVEGWSCERIREMALKELYLSPQNMAYFREKCGPKNPPSVVTAKPSAPVISEGKSN